MNKIILEQYGKQKESSFYAHLVPLHQEIERLNSLDRPVNVLEWGSGVSSIQLCEMLKPASRILSVEDNPKYKLDIPSEYQTRLCQVILKVQQKYFSENYTTYPVAEYMKTRVPYDLVVIDGRNRADCLAIAAMILADDGTVILGDAERKNYHSSFSLYGKVELIRFGNTNVQTAVLNDSLCELSPRQCIDTGSQSVSPAFSGEKG